jgi:hypothetical protein
VGNGLNTILRPQNGPNNRSGTLRDNLFELNFTHETLTFLDWTVLGDVPNRGFDKQPDVNLRGIPYTQQIKNLANEANGKADLDPNDPKTPGIHFEQGLFMRTPALKPFNDSFTAQTEILAPTITRMASIPHGTTINAQCVDPTIKKSGAPQFVDLDKQIILPFTFSGNVVTAFPQTVFKNDVDVDQIPLAFEKFKAAGTITEAQFNNPNNVLKENNDKKRIIDHVTFTVATKPTLALWGGGTDNIAQLAEPEIAQPGTANTATHNAETSGTSKANANAVKVTCQYWISTVQDTIRMPAFEKATLPRINPDPALHDKDDNIVWPVASPPATAGVRKPSFKIMLNGNQRAQDVTVAYTQIQYSQNVSLDFGPLRWPHISVATLVPADPVIISSESNFRRI